MPERAVPAYITSLIRHFEDLRDATHGGSASRKDKEAHHRTRQQLPFVEEVSLVLSNVLWTQTIRRAVEMSCEPFDVADVVACGTLGVMTSLEFFQHDFS